MSEMEGPPNIRSFSLDSDEAYAALCRRRDRPWIPNGSLPREPRAWEREAIIEPSTSGRVGPSGGWSASGRSSPLRGRGSTRAQRERGEGANI
jgi:hypothetical protein